MNGRSTVDLNAENLQKLSRLHNNSDESLLRNDGRDQYSSVPLMPGLLSSGANRVESKLSKTQNTRAVTQNQSRSPKASRKISNMNLLSSNNIQSTDYLKHASK